MGAPQGWWPPGGRPAGEKHGRTHVALRWATPAGAHPLRASPAVATHTCAGARAISRGFWISRGPSLWDIPRTLFRNLGVQKIWWSVRAILPASSPPSVGALVGPASCCGPEMGDWERLGSLCTTLEYTEALLPAHTCLKVFCLLFITLRLVSLIDQRCDGPK